MSWMGITIISVLGRGKLSLREIKATCLGPSGSEQTG